MPGLKGTTAPAQKKGLNNFAAAMERREQEREPQTVAVAPRLVREDTHSGDVSGGPIYANQFSKVGTTTRSRYESDKMPRVHQILFDEIKNALAEKEESIVKLAPILEKLEISRNQAQLILSCLEAYGYLKITRATTAAGKTAKGLVFKIMKV